MIASIRLDNLHCIAERDADGSTPYLWFALLLIDDDTLASGALVAETGFAAAPTGARIPIGRNIKTGDDVPIPAEMDRHYGARVRPGQAHRDLLIITALWKQRDTPFDAMLAGYLKFLDGVPAAVAANLIGLSDPNPVTQQATIDTIQATIQSQIQSAIESKLSTWDKLLIWSGLAHPDAIIGSAFNHVTVDEHDSTTPFVLGFGGSPPTCEISCRLVVVADPCEDQLVRVLAAQQSIANTNGAIQELLSAGETSKTEKQLEALDAELADLQAQLDAAQADLATCRAAG